jgi:hypothetical protein
MDGLVDYAVLNRLTREEKLKTKNLTQCNYTLRSGQYYPSGTTGTVPRAYDMFRAYEEMEGTKNENKEMKNMKI